ncbi:unnamed protein product [Didymodactylos carnosus]|uniref:Uncharacterized protein n=1 Tax=Didymodactylos carnosus TaxID=1234261 RepID=A0A814R0Z6_9BILA|nr:unnamed protein product [Didymodactylos carnosus]CAF1393881.1 unnamed protein product [Didymodactylos carnosus]CAF3890422.1 unnamed protein product [Didymodactylos carnosus]CAF4201418.1 unnamed protein product [Didymodactylos carnosus]
MYLGGSYPYQSNPYQQAMNNRPYYGAQGVNYPYAGQAQYQQYPNTGQFLQYGQYGYQNQYYNKPSNQYGYNTQYGTNYNNPQNGGWHPSSGTNSAGYSGYPYWNDGKRHYVSKMLSVLTLFSLLLFELLKY